MPLEFEFGGGGGGGAFDIGGGGGAGGTLINGGGGGAFVFFGGNIWIFVGDAFIGSFCPPTDLRLSGEFDDNLFRLKLSLLLPPKAQTGSLK